MGKPGSNAPTNNGIDREEKRNKNDKALGTNKTDERSIENRANKNVINKEKDKKNYKKKRRGGGSKRWTRELRIVYNNIRGYKNKEESVKGVIEQTHPAIMILLETFLEEHDKVDEKFYKDFKYKVTRLERKGKYGG